MAMQQPLTPPVSAPQSNKSSVWLIIIIILVVGAILWPLLRRDQASEDDSTLPDDLTATTTISLDDLIGAETGLTVGGSAVANQTASAGITAAAPGDAMFVRVYFGNRNLDPQGAKCERVYPVWRSVPRTAAVGRASLAELLTGPTPAESAVGVFTSINPGVKLQGLTIENGVARADFSRELGTEVGGACLVSAIRAQITETLRQFGTVRSVVLSINGVSEGILQP